MRQEDAEKGPLEWLACALDCAYLSDLKQPELRGRLARMLPEVPRGKWSVQAWQDAGGYLTGEACSAQSEQEARGALERLLGAEETV